MSNTDASFLARLRRVRLLLLDVDGVLTDGQIHYTESGETLKSFHVHDGLGIRLLQDSGIEIGVITARRSAPLERRVADLKIAHVFMGRHDKAAAYDELKSRLGLEDRDIAYVGDDIIDLPVMRQVGLAVCVANGHPYVKAQAHLVTTARGGNGAIRELADLILDARFVLAEAYERFLEGNLTDLDNSENLQ